MVALLLYTLISLAPANNCHDLVAIRELRRELTFTPAPDNPVFPLWVYNWRDKMGLPVTPRRTPPKPTELVSSAREYLGVPYDWGGVSAKGFDCSGFVNKVYAENGYDIPRTSREQYKVGMEVDRAHLKTGDLLFFSSEPQDSKITHVAMYLDNEEFIHAAMGRGEVGYGRLTASYYALRLKGARRILSLPPGQYSNDYGGARNGFLLKPNGKRAKTPSKDLTLDLPPELLAEMMSKEHAEEERPLQLHFEKGAITRVGPDLLTQDTTSIGVRSGVGYINKEALMLIAPEFTYFGQDNALRMIFAAPLAISMTGNFTETLIGNWKHPMDFTKVIREVTYGQKEAALYVDLSRTVSGSLGHGQIMRYYTPNIASHNLPRYGVEPDALSLSFDGAIRQAGFEAFVDNIFDPDVFGTMAFVKPARFSGDNDSAWDRFSVAASYATDLRAPYLPIGTTNTFTTRSVHALGLTPEYKAYHSDVLDIKTYADASMLIHPEGTGMGGAIGTLLRSNLFGQPRHVFRLRFETRASSASFIPTYFDVTYKLGRQQAPSDGNTPITKLALIDNLQHAPSRWSMYGELTYRFLHRITAGLSYEDGQNFGSSSNANAEIAAHLDRNMMVFVNLANIYIPNTRLPIGFSVAYHLRNFDKLTPFFAFQRTNEYLFATASVGINRYMQIAGTIRKAFAPTIGNRGALDGSLDLLIAYEL
jgi:hypothetical protein